MCWISCVLGGSEKVRLLCSDNKLTGGRFAHISVLGFLALSLALLFRGYSPYGLICCHQLKVHSHPSDVSHVDSMNLRLQHVRPKQEEHLSSCLGVDKFCAKLK